MFLYNNDEFLEIWTTDCDTDGPDFKKNVYIQSNNHLKKILSLIRFDVSLTLLTQNIQFNKGKFLL